MSHTTTIAATLEPIEWLRRIVAAETGAKRAAFVGAKAKCKESGGLRPKNNNLDIFAEHSAELRAVSGACFHQCHVPPGSSITVYRPPNEWVKHSSLVAAAVWCNWYGHPFMIRIRCNGSAQFVDLDATRSQAGVRPTRTLGTSAFG